MGQQTSTKNMSVAKRGSTNLADGMSQKNELMDAEHNQPFQIIRNAQEVFAFVDNVSEGTNRMSAIKLLKQSKLSGSAPH